MRTITYILTFLAATAAGAATLDLGAGTGAVTATSATIGFGVASTNATNPVVTVYFGTANGGTNAAWWAGSTNLGARAVGTGAVTVAGLAAGRLYYWRPSGIEGTNGTNWAAASGSFWTTASGPTNSGAPHYSAVMVDTNGFVVWPTNLMSVAVTGTISSLVMPGGPLFGDWFDWSFERVMVGVPDSTQTITNDDAILTRTLYSGATTDWTIDYSQGRGSNAVTVTTGDAGIATASMVRAYYVSSGTTAVTAAKNGFSRSTNLIFASSFSGTNDLVTGAVAGSLRKAAKDPVNAAVATGGVMNIYVTMDHTATNYVRATNCWAGGFDFTCRSVWNSSGGTNKAGTLVSRDVVLLAAHYTVPTGTVFRWIDRSNAVVQGTAAAVSNIPGSDVSIVRMAAPVATNQILPAAIFTNDVAKYIGGTVPMQLPAIWIDCEERAVAIDVSSFDTSYLGTIPYTAPRVAARAAYWESPVTGDSGSPAFVVLTGQARPVLAMTATTVLGGADPNYWAAQILAAAAAMGGDTNIVRQSMSGFTNYQPEPPAP